MLLFENSFGFLELGWHVACLLMVEFFLINHEAITRCIQSADERPVIGSVN